MQAQSERGRAKESEGESEEVCVEPAWMARSTEALIHELHDMSPGRGVLDI